MRTWRTLKERRGYNFIYHKGNFTGASTKEKFVEVCMLNEEGLIFMKNIVCDYSCSLDTWPGRPGFNLRSSHTKDFVNIYIYKKKDIDTRLTKAWTAIDRLSIIWKSDLTDKMKRSFFQAAVVSILLYGCTTWTLTKRLERRLDGNYTRMLRAVLNKSWRQHPTRLQLYGHLPPITKTIQVRRTRHAGHCWRSKDELISDVLLWTPTYGCARVGRPARTYIQQLCEDTGCNPEDLPETMNDREKWRERVKDIRAGGATWWWWWYIYICVCVCVYNFNLYIQSTSRMGTFFDSTHMNL